MFVIYISSTPCLHATKACGVWLEGEGGKCVFMVPCDEKKHGSAANDPIV